MYVCMGHSFRLDDWVRPAALGWGIRGDAISGRGSTPSRRDFSAPSCFK